VSEDMGEASGDVARAEGCTRAQEYLAWAEMIVVSPAADKRAFCAKFMLSYHTIS